MNTKYTKILEIGSGINYYEGQANEDVIHLDCVKLPHVEVVCRFGIQKSPFKNESFNVVKCFHVLEHLDDLVPAMQEIHRILKKKGRLDLEVPYFASPGAFADPTHKKFFTYKTLDYWDSDTVLGGGFGHEVGNARFTIIKKNFLFGKVGWFFPILIISKYAPLFYESTLSRIFPARAISVILEKSEHES